MDELLPVLLSFPPHPLPPTPISDQQYDEGIKSQIENIRKLSSKNLLQATSSGEHMLSVINPALNTIPYIFVLLANISAFQNQATNAMDGEILWEKIIIFLENFDPRQIRYVGSEFGRVISDAANIARRAQQPAIAVAPISNAIVRLEESASTFTSTHLLVARLALESGAYMQALSIVDRQILYFPGLTHQSKPKYLCSRNLPGSSYITSDTGLTEKLRYQDILEYFLLCGTIYIALHEWTKALDSLESAVTYPVKDNAVSKIMVDAYKKWILVILLLHGKTCGLPSTTNSATAKSYHMLAKPYDVVASLFSSASASRLQAEVHVGEEIWKDDGNLGLMLYVLASYQKFQIRSLANVYRTISISEVTMLTVSAETGSNLPSDQATETLIAQMITDGDLNAVVSHPRDGTPVLSFSPIGPVLPETEVRQKLAHSLERIKSMTEEIKSTDRRLTLDKDYLKWAHKQKKLERSGLGDGLGGEEMVWNPAEDEDLMSSNL